MTHTVEFYLYPNDSYRTCIPMTQTVSKPKMVRHFKRWDEDIDNGFRPDGLIRLSETMVDNVQYIQDHGNTFDTGTGKHTVVLYRAKSMCSMGCNNDLQPDYPTSL